MDLSVEENRVSVVCDFLDRKMIWEVSVGISNLGGGEGCFCAPILRFAMRERKIWSDPIAWHNTWQVTQTNEPRSRSRIDRTILQRAVAERLSAIWCNSLQYAATMAPLVNPAVQQTRS